MVQDMWDAGVDESILDDVVRLDAADPSGMLPQVASSARQVRESAALAREVGVDSLAADGRPRAVLVAGTGTSAAVGDALAAVAGSRCPVPVLGHNGFGLPGWVGVTDVVIAISGSGRDEAALSALEEADRRGCRTVAVGLPDSPLAHRAGRARALFLPAPVADGRPTRAGFWALLLPAVAVVRALGLLPSAAEGPEAVEAAAVRLEDLAVRCRPASETFISPAKVLALELAGSLPLLWGTTALTAAAASRAAGQLAANAGYPALLGTLPDSASLQAGVLDGPFGVRGADGGPAEDFFRDRVDDGAEPVRLRLVLLRDQAAEHPTVTRQAEAAVTAAAERAVAVTELSAQGASRLERLASLVGLFDYTSVYLALALGVDPTPVAAARDLSAPPTPAVRET
ncbi:Bifunctional glucose-6-phosphate/mannose-6-phosphate isomerase [Candidatus Protofrankia datiscae]|uniref:Bifunctional glucose-6-phosphate/mannose-6-phosphate isomerase n=2 Tax=Frankiaceae TaxID=74712 RepID=F8AYT7_9ACTN|nr:Bifunctional glucose-6-phosphate/mannose-6-phosphate isomerase [Candidatus Protofrankia datiscae]